uniref:Golgin candidate 5 n=1 Tax=Rhizophora mucronata TaxID=61149 RepID=A0A2P2LT10_RHIMU
MAWFGGKVSLGNFPDLAGAVNKISESVKNLEKNFDGAFGLEDKPSDSTSTATATADGLWPVMTFMGQKSEDHNAESSWKSKSPQKLDKVEEKQPDISAAQQTSVEEKIKVEEKSENVKEEKDDGHSEIVEKKDDEIPEADKDESELESKPVPIEPPEFIVDNVKTSDLIDNLQEKETTDVASTKNLEPVEHELQANAVDDVEDDTIVDGKPKVHDDTNVHDQSSIEVDVHESKVELKTQPEKPMEESSLVQAEVSSNDQMKASSDSHIEASSDSQAEAATDPSVSQPSSAKEPKMDHDFSLPLALPSDEVLETISSSVSHESDANTMVVEQNEQILDQETDTKEHCLSSGSSASDAMDSMLELNKVKLEMKMMETALQGAAKQAQAKADEIAKLMNENEHLKAVIEDLKRKSPDAEIESLREEYHQRVAAIERKVYALTKERDTLRREQSKKSDAAVLLKEKDEIINQVMAEGEELSKKQAAQEATMRKLRAQIRELEEEKKGLTTKLQVEENKVESIKKDKTATEKLLQETMEKHQEDLAAQKEYYTNALTAAKEAEALAEARANKEARTELDSRLREAEERESMLVQTLEELRQTLSRTEQQAVFREDMLQRDIEDLQKRYQVC